MKGQVLEIGNGRTRRRGRFKPPLGNVHSWVFLDIDRTRSPHVQAAAESLPFRNGAFDTIVCLEVLEYVTEPSAALGEAHRVLSSGGVLIVATPFLHRADTEHDYWRFTEHSLRYLLGRAGFDVQETARQGNALAVAANILKYAIYAQQNRTFRRLWAVAFIPLFYLLMALDRVTARQTPVLQTFATGYLVAAQKP